MKLTSEQEQSTRWQELLAQTSLTAVVNKHGKVKFEFLEQLHVFALAHILRRPVIVYADNVLRNPKGI